VTIARNALHNLDDRAKKIVYNLRQGYFDRVPMKILLVEDDDRITEPLAEDLRHQSHVVDIAYDGLAGWEFTQSTSYDAILLDWMLPKLDGVQLCQKLRQNGCQAYILLLTAKDTIGDKVVGLDAGADDYLVKPFELNTNQIKQ
jgi:two-component system, OmpR family, response regulator QseB